MDERGADESTESRLVCCDAKPQLVLPEIDKSAWTADPCRDHIPAIARRDGHDRACRVAF
jgi:hypothetical protein